jgi:transposase
MQVTTIGLDIAKNVFQVHAIDTAEKVVVRKQLRRSQVVEFFKALPACLVGMEACATAHYWARELTKLGHLVRLMPAKDVKAYVKRNKNDAADAEAICEAVRRPTMRFVQVKSAEQQGRLMLHRTRDLLMRQRTQLINALRAHLAELAIVAAQGNAGLKELLKIIAGERDARLPVDAHASLVVLAAGSGSHQGQRPQWLHRDGGKPSRENRPPTWLHPNASQNVRFLLHCGRRPYMAPSATSLDVRCPRDLQ